MISPATFFKAFGLFSVIILLVGGMIYWLITIFKKFFPNFKYWFKYSILKAKYNENDVIKLMQYDDAGLTVYQVKRLILLSGFELNKANEFCYIYEKIQKKGGKKNGK